MAQARRARLAADALAWAGTAVGYWREGALMTTVVDDGSGDLDLDPLEIRVDFTLINPGFWSATGTIIAIGGGLLPVETIVTDLLIQNVGGPVINEAFFVEHEFTASLIATPFTAELDGEYHKLQPALNIGIADLLDIPRVNDEDIGAIDPPAQQRVDLARGAGAWPRRAAVARPRLAAARARRGTAP